MAVTRTCHNCTVGQDEPVQADRNAFRQSSGLTIERPTRMGAGMLCMGRLQSFRACVSRGTVQTGKHPHRGKPRTARVSWPCVSQVLKVSQTGQTGSREFYMRQDDAVGGPFYRFSPRRRGVVKLRGNRGREAQRRVGTVVWPGRGPVWGQPSARIGMCKWPTFRDPRLLLANAGSSSRSMIGWHTTPTICPDDMSFSYLQP